MLKGRFMVMLELYICILCFPDPENKTTFNSSISITLKLVDCDQVKKLLILFSLDFDKLRVSHRLEVFPFLRLQSGRR